MNNIINPPSSGWANATGGWANQTGRTQIGSGGTLTPTGSTGTLGGATRSTGVLSSVNIGAVSSLPATGGITGGLTTRTSTSTPVTSAPVPTRSISLGSALNNPPVGAAATAPVLISTAPTRSTPTSATNIGSVLTGLPTPVVSGAATIPSGGVSATNISTAVNPPIGVGSGILPPTVTPAVGSVGGGVVTGGATGTTGADTTGSAGSAGAASSADTSGGTTVTAPSGMSSMWVLIWGAAAVGGLFLLGGKQASA